MGNPHVFDKMAEDALGLSIINLLKTKANHCIELKDISRQLKIHKKELNVELYRLKRQGILNKVQESPPVWQLNSTSSGIHLPLRPKHSRKKYEKEFHRGGKTGGYRHGHSFGQKRVILIYQSKVPCLWIKNWKFPFLFSFWNFWKIDFNDLYKKAQRVITLYVQISQQF